MLLPLALYASAADTPASVLAMEKAGETLLHRLLTRQFDALCTGENVYTADILAETEDTLMYREYLWWNSETHIRAELPLDVYTYDLSFVHAAGNTSTITEILYTQEEPTMKHIIVLFLAVVLLLSGCCRCVEESCRCAEGTDTAAPESVSTVPVSDGNAPRKITYSVEKILEEEVTDYEFNRNIRIFEIHTNSANRDKIEQYITYFPYSLYFQYINYGVPYEWQNLGMDAEIHEVDGILCAGALVCRQLEWEFFRLYSQCVYLDLENDVLLTYEEAAAALGLDVAPVHTAIAASVEEYYKSYTVKPSEDTKTYDIVGFVYHNEEPYFICRRFIYDSYYEDKGNLTYPWWDTVLYRYSDGKLLFMPDGDTRFTGIDSMRSFD